MRRPDWTTSSSRQDQVWRGVQALPTGSTKCPAFHAVFHKVTNKNLQEASRHVNADSGHSNNTNSSPSIPDFTMGFKRLPKLAGRASGVHSVPDLSLSMLVPMPCGTQTESWPVFRLYLLSCNSLSCVLAAQNAMSSQRLQCMLITCSAVCVEPLLYSLYRSFALQPGPTRTGPCWLTSAQLSVEYSFAEQPRVGLEQTYMTGWIYRRASHVTITRCRQQQVLHSTVCRQRECTAAHAAPSTIDSVQALNAVSRRNIVLSVHHSSNARANITREHHCRCGRTGMHITQQPNAVEQLQHQDRIMMRCTKCSKDSVTCRAYTAS